MFELEVFDDGSGPALYAGGTFTAANGIVINHLARLEGDTWQPLEAGVGGNVSSLAACQECPDAGPSLYAGGSFQTAGGVEAAGVARWDGHTWSPLGTGMTPGGVGALAIADNDSGEGTVLYAGGSFYTAGGVLARGVARWDGTTWSALGSGLGGDVYALAVFDDGSGPALYAGGDITIVGGVGQKHIARWDGRSWSWVGGGINGFSFVNALVVHDDGSGPALYAGGWFDNAGSVPVANIARWDGVSWSDLPGGGLDGFVKELAVLNVGSGPVLGAGGFFTSAGGVPAARIALWDGNFMVCDWGRV